MNPTIVLRPQLLEAVPGLKPKTLNYLLRNREANGLSASGAVLRFGNEFSFDLDAFIAFLRSKKA